MPHSLFAAPRARAQAHSEWCAYTPVVLTRCWPVQRRTVSGLARAWPACALLGRLNLQILMAVSCQLEDSWDGPVCMHFSVACASKECMHPCWFSVSSRLLMIVHSTSWCCPPSLITTCRLAQLATHIDSSIVSIGKFVAFILASLLVRYCYCKC